MSEFVEECRREWKRLRVPDPVANEMAADLDADLREAEAEGRSLEDVVGNAAFDPRDFARSWAGERGLVQADSPHRRTRFIATAAAASVLLAAGIAAAVLSLTRSPAHDAASTARVPTATVAAPIRMPDLLGLPPAQAITQARTAGLKVTIRYRQGSGTATVIAQSPAAGTEISRDATVSLVVRK